MVDFEDRKETEEEREERLFNETTQKQMKATKATLFLVFFILGLIFLFVGLMLFITMGGDGAVSVTAYVFMGLGAFYVVLGVVLKKVIPDKLDYKKNKARMERYGANDTFTLNVRLRMLEEKVKELEKKVDELENGRRF